MHVEFTNGLPRDLRTVLLLTLVDRVVRIDDEFYRIDGYNSVSREFRARRATADGQVVPGTATESIFTPGIQHLVIDTPAEQA